MPLRLGLTDRDREAVKLDVKNQKLLGELGNNSRTPLSELSRKLKINRDTLAYRIKKLQEGVISSLITRVDLAALQHSVFHVFLFIEETDDKRVQELIDYLQANDRTLAIATYNDKWDLEWVLTAKNHLTFDHALRQLFTEFGDIVIEKDILVVIKEYPTITTQYQKPARDFESRATDIVAIDEKDLAILEQLAMDSRANAVSIANNIGLGVDATIRRIKQLVNERVIKNFSIHLNRYKLNQNEYAFLVQMRKFSDEDEAKFTEFVRAHPHISQAKKVLGKWDILMHITGTIGDYHKTVKELKKLFRENIKNYDSWTMYAERVITPLPKIVGKNLF